MSLPVKPEMDEQIDFAGLKAHIIETLTSALNEGTEAAKGLGPGYAAWAVEAFKVKIAERSREQTFVSPETYARIAATVFREAMGA